MRRTTAGLAGTLLASVLVLAGCDTAEERAEGHYARAMALAAEGDVERAGVEFRNVFRLDGGHTRARLAYARLLRDTGDPEGAIAQYLRLLDQDRQSLEGHRDLAALALEMQDFATAGTHAARATALDPADTVARGVKAAVDFRAGDREQAVALAEAVLAEDAASVPAHMVVIAARMAEGDHAGALARIDAGLAAVPGDEGLHLARLAALEQAGDMAGAGAELRRMAELFPANPGVTRALIQWHLREGDAAGAEAALRAAAARAAGTPEAVESNLAVVRFLLEVGGEAAARAELERLAAAGGDTLPYRRALAGLDFAAGRSEAAIAALRALTADPGVLAAAEADAADADALRDVEVALAGMLAATGAEAESDALVAAVLAADRSHVEALKLRARRAVAQDRPEEAIRDLRTALAEAPGDPELMTIMAMAHEREGNRELMGERLARAVEASAQGPEESIRYARFLLGEGRPGPAEGVLVDALRRAPEHPDLLAALGTLHLERRDWPRVRQTAAILRGLDDPAAAEAAAALERASLEGEGRRAETIAALEALADAEGGAEDDTALAARIELVSAHVAAGDLAAAEAQVAALLADDPASVPGRMMQAGLAELAGAPEAAEAVYRALIAERPELAGPHGALFALLAGQGRLDAAEAAVDAGLAATGGDPDLAFAKAGLLEAAGDFEGAIAVYEALYAADTGNPVLANNLASLLATHRADAESLARAFAIARRLRDTEVPQFQDTYGWILVRRGDAAGALAYLEPAAAALAEDPLVQYHLAMAYDALGRGAEARGAFARAVALADSLGDSRVGASPLPQIAAARARLAELEAAPPATAPAAVPEPGPSPAPASGG
jgi:Tfp pilus assembly protein PilF